MDTEQKNGENVIVDVENSKADGESPVAKRLKTGHDEPELVLLDDEDSVHDTLTNLGNVQLVETLNEHATTTFLRCRFVGTEAFAAADDDESAVIILEKKPFTMADIEHIFSAETTVKQTLRNDVYGTYDCRIKPEYNEVKATVIHPATKKHVDKYRRRPTFVVRETADDYVRITLPYIEERTQLSLQWVENILEHKTESDRIVFEDPDPEDGFVLLPDMKWNRERIEDLYLVAICHRRGIRSLRDLRADQHLPLLRNIRNKGLSAIQEKYGIGEHELRIFVHYQPSYYHLHVHFTHVRGDGAMMSAERCHPLDAVLGNLELVADYYRLAPITYAVKEGDPLHDKFKAAGKFELKKSEKQSH